MNTLSEMYREPYEGGSQITLEEAVDLGAQDSEFFGQFFFPNTCRQHSPPFHREMDLELDDPANRYVDCMVFRGGAKTTKLRLLTAKRISYGLARTIIFVGKSQEHSVKSLTWLKNAVKRNHLWAGAFGLVQGSKWADTEAVIEHKVLGIHVTVIALGITGSVRGVNIDDYRPDLIVVDDPCDEENTATAEQRKKISDLFFGAIQKSLAPASEAPHAKMVLLQTVLNDEDLISQCQRDSQWKSLTFGCFDDSGKSRWPERWTTEELLAEKQAHIDRNQLSLWLREMECKVVSEEGAAFLPHWLNYYTVAPEGGVTILSIDPTPPPRLTADGQVKVTRRHDDAVIMAIKITSNGIYVLDYYTSKSPDPYELIEQLFSAYLTHRPILQVNIETVLFQRVLASMLKKEMTRRKLYMTIKMIEDKRAKPLRIKQELSAYASNKQLYVRRGHHELIEQFLHYPDVSHDDILDALSIGLMEVDDWLFEGDLLDGEYTVEMESDDMKLEDWRGAP